MTLYSTLPIRAGPGRNDDVGRLQSTHHIGGRQAPRLQRIRVHINHDLPDFAAKGSRVWTAPEW